MPSRLKAAIPKLASLNIERSVAFFERLGFTRRYSDKDYGSSRETMSSFTSGYAWILEFRKKRDVA